VLAAVLMKRIAGRSPRFKARIAGALQLLSVLMAAFTELFVRGPLNIAGGLIAVSGMAAVTLLLCDIFKPVNRGLSMLAAFSSLVGLTLFNRQSGTVPRISIGSMVTIHATTKHSRQISANYGHLNETAPPVRSPCLSMQVRPSE
jgi:hypothetical protein